MLQVGPTPLLPGSDAVSWRVTAHGELVATLCQDHAGRWWAHLNLHHAIGGKVQHVELASFDTERLERWARANEARLLRECEPVPLPPPPDLSPEAFGLTPPPQPVVRQHSRW